MTHLFAFVVLAFVTTAWTRPQTGGPGGNIACAKWCAANFPINTGSVCTSPAAHGTGPCWECGPQNTSPNKKLCNGACTDTNTDKKNCGACGTVCPSGSSCISGTCVCSGGKPLCHGACPDLLYDPQNCGTCGTVCSSSNCVNGACACNPIGASCDSTTASSCCSGHCGPFGGPGGTFTPGCCNPGGQPCDIPHPEDCCSGTCALFSLHPSVYHCQ
ncbi:hypothetical protein B0J13DRAFT_564330 [Dactylonectria estremocensis]|uniref:Uncharacterized protein n=1 Tax=Dactylonectria estremocensis TaxID=1079267 RepID=A0A9P9ISK1_9HYPO|nr:hypothetical protein B0J13DRAFT_564330 [Dactylonectria estremocensis]